MRKLRPGVAQEHCNPSPKLTGCVLAPTHSPPPPQSSSSQGPPPPPPRERLLHVYPQQRARPAGSGKAAGERPSCGGGIKEQLLGGLQPGKAEAFLSPPPRSSLPVPSALRSPWRQQLGQLGGKNLLERRDLISDPELVSGIVLDSPKPSLGPWACLGDHGLSLPRLVGAGGAS